MTSVAESVQPIPSPEQKKLGVFLGTWHTTGDVASTPSTPAVKVDAIDTYEWYAGEFFLVHNADSKMGDDVIKSLEVIGYDAQRQCYLATFFDSTGGYGIEEVRVANNTWTWRGTNVMGVKEHRCVAVFSDDGNTIAARHEKSDDGKNWELWMDIILTKQG